MVGSTLDIMTSSCILCYAYLGGFGGIGGSLLVGCFAFWIFSFILGYINYLQELMKLLGLVIQNKKG